MIKRKKHKKNSTKQVRLKGHDHIDIGTRVEIYWPGDNKYYLGSVINIIGEMHIVQYDDKEVYAEDLRSHSLIWKRLSESENAVLLKLQNMHALTESAQFFDDGIEEEEREDDLTTESAQLSDDGIEEEEEEEDVTTDNNLPLKKRQLYRAVK